jgi:hypothetical protein
VRQDRRYRRVSEGMFLGNPPPPQDISLALMRQTHVGLVDEPGIRLAETTGRASATYHAADLQPQQFVRQPAGPNAPELLEQAAVSAGNARQALSRNRGRPGVML